MKAAVRSGADPMYPTIDYEIELHRSAVCPSL